MAIRHQVLGHRGVALLLIRAVVIRFLVRRGGPNLHEPSFSPRCDIENESRPPR